MNKELLRMERIDTYVGGRQILHHARLNLLEGEIVGLVGVNQSGKTVLAGGISGRYPITAGNLYLSEQPVTVGSLQDGCRAGVWHLSRSTGLIPDFSVLQNFTLSNRRNCRLIHRQEEERRCREMLELLGLDVDPHVRASALSVKETLFVEIARALCEEVRVLILDDVFDMLSNTALEELGQILKLLCSLHIGIVLIDSSPSLIQRFCRRMFVMRSGQTVAVLDRSTRDDALLISLMLGSPAKLESQQPGAAGPRDTVLLELEQVACSGVLSDLSFRIYRGERVGILNLGKHSGQALTALLRGLLQPDRGTLKLDGQPVCFRSCRQAVRRGISVFSSQDAVFPGLSLEDNIMFPALPRYSGLLGVMNQKALRFEASELLHTYLFPHYGLSITEESITRDRALRWDISFCRMLSTRPRLAVLTNPTEKIDILNKERMYEHIRSLQGRGVTTLVISSDIHELLATCDRFLVLAHGRISTRLSDDPTREELLALYSRQTEQT